MKYLKAFKNKFLFFFNLILIALLVSSCRVYNFSGSSLSPDLKTISISNFANEVGTGPARMAQNFTEKLKDYYSSNTSLKIVKSNADLYLDGAIVGYQLTPLAPTGQETASQNRLTISIKYKYENTKDSTQNVSLQTNQYADFAQNVSFSSVENEKIDEIIEKLLLDIFQKTTANW
ncbi:MAG: hypothetical protein EAZ27_02315 [Cytophagales bacterium]|nr:MAG: hypothetical protein EAZ27_02315 [Cytophagales bacterium]